MFTTHYMSHVTCHMPCVTCCMSRFTCRIAIIFCLLSSQLNIYIWVIICIQNSDPIHVIFSQSLLLQRALLCLPGSLELGCNWTAPQCKSPQVINLAKSKVFFFIFSANYFGKTLNCHISLIVRAFDLISKLRARPQYQLSSKYINGDTM